MPSPPITGAEALLRTLAAHGADTCFMNPGTSEMQFVSALDRVPGVRGVLCLDESVAAGAADGYARVAGKPAATLLHLGPGLANALSNLHNARKARSGVVNIAGEHASWHLAYDAPLTADIEAIAQPFSGYIATPRTAAEVAPRAAEAIAAARAGEVATLIIPADASWELCPPGIPELPPAQPAPPGGGGAANGAAPLLRALGRRAGLLLSGCALDESALEAAARIHAGTGARIFANRNSARLPRGRGVFPALRVPYFPEPAEQALAGLELLYTVETVAPVTFFGYPGRPSTLTPPGCRVEPLPAAALEALARLCGGAPAPFRPDPPTRPPDGPLTPGLLGQALAALLPEGAIVSDEMISSGEAVNAHLASAARHDLLPVTGGSIGQGLPVALGAALAAPDRCVLALQADGSAMYTISALWSFARQNARVITVIFANRRYRILDVEIERTRAGAPGPLGDAMLDLGNPTLDFVQLARGCGVPGVRAATVNEFIAAFEQALARSGPFLIEAVL